MTCCTRHDTCRTTAGPAYIRLNITIILTDTIRYIRTGKNITATAVNNDSYIITICILKLFINIFRTKSIITKPIIYPLIIIVYNSSFASIFTITSTSLFQLSGIFSEQCNISTRNRCKIKVLSDLIYSHYSSVNK